MYMFALFCDLDNSCRVNMDNVPIEVRELFQMSMDLGDAITNTVIYEISCCFQHCITKYYNAMWFEMIFLN